MKTVNIVLSAALILLLLYLVYLASSAKSFDLSSWLKNIFGNGSGSAGSQGGFSYPQAWLDITGDRYAAPSNTPGVPIGVSTVALSGPTKSQADAIAATFND